MFVRKYISGDSARAAQILGLVCAACGCGFDPNARSDRPSLNLGTISSDSSTFHENGGNNLLELAERVPLGELSRSVLGSIEGEHDVDVYDFGPARPGDRLIVEEFKKRQPQAKVLILGIFPRAAEATNPYRASIKDINSKLAKLADNKQVFFMDIGDKFLAPDGTLTTDIMPDGLHPNLKGYKIWADAISARVKELMK